MTKQEELRDRTKKFAVRIVKLFKALPKTDEARIFGKQLLRSGTSVGANYRAVCRARSHAEFVAKIGVVVEEADETVFWLELLIETEIITATKLGSLLEEANQLLAIMAVSQTTAKRNSPRFKK
ncbi:MAG: four helix bundle protein [Acidobacteria bacterium]|nr:four helix bundle protein [Acidobacteriota bacterium]